MCIYVYQKILLAVSSERNYNKLELADKTVTYLIVIDLAGELFIVALQDLLNFFVWDVLLMSFKEFFQLWNIMKNHVKLRYEKLETYIFLVNVMIVIGI